MLPYKDHDILYLQNKEFEENVKYSFSNDNFFLAKFFLRLYYWTVLLFNQKEKRK